jgi:CNT family concentrative nucleoside transporter
MSLKLISLLGLATFPLIAWALSLNRRRFPWRAASWGLGLQLGFALLILKTNLGRMVFDTTQLAVNRLISFANEGAQMVFGPLAKGDLLTAKWGAENAYIFVIGVSATIIVVSALSSLLYHWGVLQRVVQAIAWVMQRTMRTSGSETLAAAAEIFMGHTEAPLIVRPYLKGMTRSELLAMMTAGLATVAGGVMAAYVGFGISAGHLLTASVMNAPAALLMAKIMLPETEISETASGAAVRITKESINSLDALCRGASDGMKLSINVMAMLLALVSVVAMANYLLGLLQEPMGLAHPITLQTVFGWVNAPFAWLMGVPFQDCVNVGAVLGERIVLNEFFGYLSLVEMQKAGILQERSLTLATYALCGFANFASVAIQIGGVGALVPERRKDLAQLGLRAMAGGLLACYLSAAVVGVLV